MANALITFYRAGSPTRQTEEYELALEDLLKRNKIVKEQRGTFFNTSSPQGTFFPYRGNNVQILRVQSNNYAGWNQSYAIFSDSPNRADSIAQNLQAMSERLGYKTLNSVLNTGEGHL